MKELAELEKEPVGEGPPVSLREQLLGRLSDDDLFSQKRDISVMTRMSPYIVEVLDSLVELEIFKSRSEVVASFVEKSIMEKKELFESIHEQASNIEKRREAAKELAFQAIQSKSKEK